MQLDGYEPAAMQPAFGSRTPQVSVNKWMQQQLSASYRHTMDRVNVLEGHTGCVNAISWARDGEMLLTGGDDTTVRIWRPDSSGGPQEHPYKCEGVVETGHRGNIFNAHMLPHSNRIATVAGDGQVRVFDVGSTTPTSFIAGETYYKRKDAVLAVLRCHTSRTKRIVAEQSPDNFLSVAEDGQVRQHDLRTRHTCRSSCPPPIVKVRHELSTLALSPLAPHQFVVAGDSPFGYLFDRRQAGRYVREEFGEVPSSSDTDLALCVRRFGRQISTQERKRLNVHVTGARMSAYNGHEVLLSYSGDGVYLFSTRDDVVDGSELLPQESGSPKSPTAGQSAGLPHLPGSLISMARNELMEADIDAAEAAEEEDGSSSSGNSDNGEEDDDEDEDQEMDDDLPASYLNDRYRPNIPVVLPRRKFVGACNVETVKDVNFLGPYDEMIVSGSDDGHFFVWDKASGNISGVYEGDGSVVNVVESHPHLPLVAVSGIDTTVKLFQPVSRESKFSRMANLEAIMKANQRKARSNSSAFVLSDILMRQFMRHYASSGHREDGEDTEGGAIEAPQCEYQ